MKSYQKREAVGLHPQARKGDTFNMVTIAADGELAQDRSLTGTDHAVMRFLTHIVDRDGYSVATLNDIRDFTGRSLSGISTAINKHVKAGRIERVGRSGFRIRGRMVIPQNWSAR